jgi:HK97 family phage portal protein
MKFPKLFRRAARKPLPMEVIQKIFSGSSDALLGRDATSFAAIDLICSSFAGLSGYFYNRQSKQALKDYPLYDLLGYPNFDETRFQFFYNSAKDYFNGNVYWYKYYEGDEVTSLFRLNPNNVRVRRNQANQKIFAYEGIEYDYRKILHIPSRYGYDGLTGKSIFSECGAIFSNTSELDAYINNSFNNSVGNRLIIDITKEYPAATEEQLQQLRNKFIQNYTGIKNAGRPLIKSGKIDYGKIETDFKDNRASQLVENRQFQEKEVAKLFGVPLPLLNGTETANIESLYTVFIENAIRPLAASFQENINRLIPLEERMNVYFEYSYNSLLKTSLQNRISAYAVQLNNGILTHNEVRRKENLPPINEEAGDSLFIQANLLPLRDKVVDAYMANSRLKLEEMENKENQHEIIGDDKQ